MKALKFKDVYGVEFGIRGNMTKYPDKTVSEFEIDFTTPNHDESDVRFTLPLMAYVMNKHMILQIIDREDNDRVLYTHNRSFSMFINDSGVDPKTGQASGHPYIGAAQPRPYHLWRNHKYALRVVRPQGHDDRNPIGISYQSLDVDVAGILLEEDNVITINGVDFYLVPVEG